MCKMKFEQALKEMQEGKKVKLPSWGGYWCWDDEKQTVMMHCKDGKVLDIRETEVVEYTLTNVLSDEWILADGENTPILGGVATFNFGEAIKYLKRGLKVARKGWNGKGMFLCYVNSGNWDMNPEVHKSSLHLLPWIGMKTADNKFVPWLASQTDILAEDWTFAE